MTFDQTRAVLLQGIQDGLHLGAQIHVSRGGDSLLHEAFGENAPGNPLRRETRMAWFSSGKPLTVTALATLAESGQLDWDDPVVNYIPEFGAGGKTAITVRHILTHTAGFRGADLLPEDLPWRQTIERICETPLEEGWIPGRRAGYQLTASWFILGEILERITGIPYADFVQTRILEPMGMTHSSLRISNVEHSRTNDIGFVYTTLNREPVAHPLWNTPAGWALCRPGSSARGPVTELARFYEVLLGVREAGPVLKRSTVEELTRRHRVGMRDETFQHVVDFGLGFVLNSNRYGIETVPYGYGRFASDEAFGHSGYQSSCAFADPKHGVVVAWICNGLPGEPRHQRRARELNSAIYRDLGIV
jgi:CubicO group peptidase (beta-lactamase class C family)